jgi:hypothetical protein
MPILFRVFKLFNFFYRKIYPKPPIPDSIPEQLKKESPENNSGDGVFSFQGYGFSIKTGQENPIVFWADIHALFGYKENRQGTDCFCLEVFYKNGDGFNVSELTPGWLRFQDKIAAHFPSVNKNWQTALADSAAETKILVYEKGNRTL